MQKFLFSILFSMFFTYFNPVFATNLFRVVLPSEIEQTAEAQIKQGLHMALSGRDIEVVLHKAETKEADAAVFASALKSPSAGVIAVVDKPNWGGSWAERVFSKRSGTQPLLSVGFTDPNAEFDAQIGAKIQDYTYLVAETFKKTQGDTLCLFSEDAQWCDLLATNTNTLVIKRSVSVGQTASMQMASTVSAMTQNPNITQIFVTDLAFYPSVQQALQIIGGTFTIGGIGDSSEKQLDFSIDAQWILQIALAIRALEVQANSGQSLTGVIDVAPRLQQ